MTENECIESLNGIYPEWCSEKEEYEMAQVAIQALEEIQQYRAIGTVKEIKIREAQFARLSEGYLIDLTSLCEYRELGTIEEFKALKEKNEPKKPIFKFAYEDGRKFHDCPICRSYVTHAFEQDQVKYCNCCGQKLDWN